jgi:hypothetical protein
MGFETTVTPAVAKLRKPNATHRTIIKALLREY